MRLYRVGTEIYGIHGLIVGQRTLGFWGVTLSSHISIFDKNYRCLKELIKIAYDPLISSF